MLRGKSWAGMPNFLTYAERSNARSEDQSPSIGFRCVRIAATGSGARVPSTVDEKAMPSEVESPAS